MNQVLTYCFLSLINSRQEKPDAAASYQCRRAAVHSSRIVFGYQHWWQKEKVAGAVSSDLIRGWLPAVDALRNLLLAPTVEMLAAIQQLPVLTRESTQYRQSSHSIF